MNKHSRIVLLLLFVGIVLRVYTCLQMPLIEDERKNVPIAKQLSFIPGSLHLPMEDPHVTHPLLNLYATKLGIILFGETPLGARFFHMLLGILTLILVYQLAKILGKQQAVIALLILTFNQYHIQHSVRADNTSMLLFFSVLAIYLFMRAIENNDRLKMMFVGPVLGLAFLTKSVSILLAPAFILFLMITPKHQKWFKSKELYLSVMLFFVVTLPWIMWVLRHGSSQLVFEPQMYDLSNLKLRRTAINFFLIQPLAWLQGIDYRLQISWEYAVMDGISGIILLIGTGWGLKHFKEDYFRLMLLIFFIMMAVLSLFALPNLKWGEFWWAELSVFSAVCLTAAWISHFRDSNKIFPWFFIAFIVYLMINSAYFLSNIKTKYYYPPHRYAAFVDDNRIVADYYLATGQEQEAVQEMRRLLQISPNSVENLSYLAWMRYQQGWPEEALQLWFKALEIEPNIAFGYNDLAVVAPKMIAHYQGQVNKTPENVEAMYMLGVLHYYQGNHDESLKHLKKAIQINPQQYSARYYMGLNFIKQMNLIKAMRALQDVVAINPDHQMAHYQIGLFYIDQQKYEQAIEQFKTVLSLNPDDANSYLRLAKIYGILGYNDLAKKYRKMSKSIYHDDLKIRYRFGTIYE